MNKVIIQNEIEKTIQDIYDAADELRVLLKIEDNLLTQVNVERWKDTWHIEVIPSLLTFGTMTKIMRRGYTGKNLKKLLNKALHETKEELNLLRNGKTRAV